MNVLTTADFNEAIKTGTVVVKFGTPYCTPCKMLDTLLKNVQIDGATFHSVNVQDEPSLATEMGIVSIPQTFIFKDGKCVRELIGTYTLATLKDAVVQYV